MSTENLNEHYLTIPREYKGNIWGSIDPINGKLVLYPINISTKIEEAYQSKLFPLNIPEFHNITIYETSQNRYCQKTDSGFRSIFRHEADSEDATLMKTVFYYKPYNSWYISHPKVSHIGFIVDKSGSMYSIYKDVVEQGIENFLEKQLEIENEVLLYGYTFSSSVQQIYNGESLKKITDLRERYYSINPSGSTAYFDAFGLAINRIDESYYPGDEVIICCMTDGMDNSSKIFNVSTLNYLISSKKELGWIITLLGTEEANILEMCNQIGIGSESGLQIGLSRAKTATAYQCLSAGINRARTGETEGLTYSQHERNISQ